MKNKGLQEVFDATDKSKGHTDEGAALIFVSTYGSLYLSGGLQ